MREDGSPESLVILAGIKVSMEGLSGLGLSLARQVVPLHPGPSSEPKCEEFPEPFR